MSNFVLIGHSNPLDQYPDVVLPVGRYDLGPLRVLYQGTGSSEVVDVDAEFVRHDEELTASLANFEPDEYRLFGYDKQNVVLVTVGGEQEFFRDLLNDSHFTELKPFTRLKFARASGVYELVLREIGWCMAGMSRSPDYLRWWAQNQLKAALGERPEFSDPPVSDSAKKRIVLVEDTPELAAIDKAHFESLGYSVWTAPDGIRGLALTLDKSPHLILLDLRMPRMNGYQTFQKLKELDETREIPVILRTAHDFEFDFMTSTTHDARVFTDVHHAVRRNEDNSLHLMVAKRDANVVMGKASFKNNEVDEAAEMLVSV